MSLVPVDLTACPDCGAPTRTITVHQPALIRHAGHGATERTSARYCVCGWHLITLRTEERP